MAGGTETRMAKPVKPVQPDPPARHVFGPRPVAALVPAITRPAFRKRAPAAAQLFADWAALVGPAMAARATPHRFAAGRLTLACPGPVAMELGHVAPQLIARLNTALGVPLVKELRFVQASLPESRALPVPPPRPDAAAKAAKSVANLPDGPVKTALMGLGASVLTARASQPSTPRRPRG